MRAGSYLRFASQARLDSRVSNPSRSERRVESLKAGATGMNGGPVSGSGMVGMNGQNWVLSS